MACLMHDCCRHCSHRTGAGETVLPWLGSWQEPYGRRQVNMAQVTTLVLN